MMAIAAKPLTHSPTSPTNCVGTSLELAKSKTSSIFAASKEIG